MRADGLILEDAVCIFYLYRLTTMFCEAYYMADVNSIIFERIGEFISASA